MDIRFELISKGIAEYVISRLGRMDIDINEITQTTAINALSEIQEVIKNEEISDFDAMEMIVCIFEKYEIDAGPRHDFG